MRFQHNGRGNSGTCGGGSSGNNVVVFPFWQSMVEMVALLSANALGALGFISDFSYARECSEFSLCGEVMAVLSVESVLATLTVIDG